MEYKEDIRIQKTRRDLRKAILDLITEKSIEKISVKEICDKAMVNRITFYKYYEDKFTLLDDTVNEIRDEIKEKTLKNNYVINTFDDASSYLAEIVKNVVEYIEDNRNLIISVQKNGDYKLFDIITYVCEAAITELLTQFNRIRKLKYPIPVAASFIYGGFVATIGYWLNHPDSINQNQLLDIINDIKNNIDSLEFLFEAK